MPAVPAAAQPPAQQAAGRMNTLRGHVLLEPSEADYLARALVLLQQLLVENRSQPTPRLQQVTAQLARCAEHGSAAGSNGSDNCRTRASDTDGGEYRDYATVTAAEAARILECGERNVRDLARRGRIPARRSGGVWLLDAGAVEARAQRQAARRAG